MSNTPLIAPWPDFLGQPIHHGDRLEHTYGQAFVAVRLDGYAEEGDAWRAIYDDASVSRLCFQIGDKRQARVVHSALAQPVTAEPEQDPDAARWQMLPAFLEKYQINYVALLRDIDAARAARPTPA